MGLFSWLNPLEIITGKLVKAYEVKQNAKTDSEKLLADQHIVALEARRDILVRDPIAPYVRLAFAVPFIIYTNKLLLWDKVLVLGVTDDLSAALQALQTLIIGFYFLNPIASLMKGRK